MTPSHTNTNTRTRTLGPILIHCSIRGREIRHCEEEEIGHATWTSVCLFVCSFTFHTSSTTIKRRSSSQQKSLSLIISFLFSSVQCLVNPEVTTCVSVNEAEQIGGAERTFYSIPRGEVRWRPKVSNRKEKKRSSYKNQTWRKDLECKHFFFFVFVFFFFFRGGGGARENCCSSQIGVEVFGCSLTVRCRRGVLVRLKGKSLHIESTETSNDIASINHIQLILVNTFSLFCTQRETERERRKCIPIGQSRERNESIFSLSLCLIACSYLMNGDDDILISLSLSRSNYCHSWIHSR